MLTEEEFNRLNSLTEEEFMVERRKMSNRDFYDFVKKQGTMTPKEFDIWVYKRIEEIWGEKL